MRSSRWHSKSMAELEKGRHVGTERSRVHFMRTVGTQTEVKAGGLWRRASVRGH